MQVQIALPPILLRVTSCMLQGSNCKQLAILVIAYLIVIFLITEQNIFYGGDWDSGLLSEKSLSTRHVLTSGDQSTDICRFHGGGV